MFPNLTRRDVLRSAIAGPALLTSAPSILRRSRGERVRVACVGVWNRGRANLEGVLDEEVVALCDVDSRHLANAVKLVEERKGEPFAGRTYADFRELLEKERDLDAVVVSTPDHTHATVAATAMRRGLHVYVEKPLAHSVHEVRVLQELAREKGLVTQMGTQIHAGENYRRVVELVRSGAIGAVSRVDVWVGKSWSDGRFGEPKPAPDHLDWDLWQGPVAEREYRDGLHPANWRRFWDYGTGTLGDMGCHYLDLAHWALDLGQPEKITATGPQDVHPEGTPAWIDVHWKHAARRGRRDVVVRWADSTRAATIAAEGFGGGGLRFVGDEGELLADYGRHVLLPEQDFRDFEPPERSIPASVGHHREWLDAIRDGGETTCDFGYSGDLTATVLLGNVAYRTRDMLWDPSSWTSPNDAASTSPNEEAGAYLSREYREGWRL